MEIIDIIIFVLIGLVTGFFSGLFGIGGGSIRIPLLTMMGLPLINAFATNMFAIPFSSGTGAYVQRKNIEWKVVKNFTIGGVLGIVIATFLVGIISNKFLAIVFFFSSILTIFGLYLNKINIKIYNRIRPTNFNLFIAPFLSNLIIGLRGGSGGTLFPSLLKAMHIKIHKAIATSLLVSFFASFFAVIIYFFKGDILFIPAIIIGVADICGAYLGSKISLITKSKWLKIGLSVIILLLSLYILYKEFSI
jgi:uncharacterized protein